MTSQQYILNFVNKPNAFRYLLQRVVNRNPYLFDVDGVGKNTYLNKKIWIAKQVYPKCVPEECSYFTTFKAAKNHLNKIGAIWSRV